MSKWQDLGRQLGVSDAELEGLKNEQKPTASVLLAAKTKNPDTLKWKDIVNGLFSIGEYKLAVTVCGQQGNIQSYCMECCVSLNVQYLTSTITDITALDGHSPLSVAAYYGWVGLLKYLVDTEGKDPKGMYH